MSRCSTTSSCATGRAAKRSPTRTSNCARSFRREATRSALASHVYDITYGEVHPEDALVCIDDSIVRGTTLKQSILKILARTNPRMIVIASTAPQIRYPDCYGIDMAEIGKFIAFEAAVALLKERGEQSLIDHVYRVCLDEVKKPAGGANQSRQGDLCALLRRGDQPQDQPVRLPK